MKKGLQLQRNVLFYMGGDGSEREVLPYLLFRSTSNRTSFCSQDKAKMHFSFTVLSNKHF